MLDQIGSAAGKLWEKLGTMPGAQITDAAKAAGIDPTVAVFAAGWLAREGKVRVEPSGKNYKLWLTDAETKSWQTAKKK